MSSNSGDMPILGDLKEKAVTKDDPQGFIASQLRRSVGYVFQERLRSHGRRLILAFGVTNTAMGVLLIVAMRLLYKFMPVHLMQYFSGNVAAQGHLCVTFFSVVFVIIGMVGAVVAVGCEIEAVSIYGAVFTALFFLSHHQAGGEYTYLLTPSLVLGAKIVRTIRAIVSKSQRRKDLA